LGRNGIGNIKINKTVTLPTVLYGHETWSHMKGEAQTEGV